MDRPAPISSDETLRIARILAPFADDIETVSLYGSRATARARRGSDLDLLLDGPIGLLDMLRLGVAFEESDLPFRVDLLHVRDLTDSATRREILGHCRMWFDRPALKRAGRP